MITVPDDRVKIRAAIFAPRTAVFRALTDARALETWFAEHVESSPAERRFAFWGRHTPFGEAPSQELLALVVDELLRFSWTVDAVESLVDLRLEPTGTGDTVLTVTHVPVPTWDFDRASLNDFWCLAVGNLANFVEGRALAPRPDYVEPPGEDALAEIVIAAPAADVFAALVDPEQLDRWLPVTAVVDPRLGGRYDFGWDHGPGELVEFEPPERLAYSWHNEGWPDTVVHWGLRADGPELTTVSLRHTGFAEGRRSDGYQMGWQTMLINLQRMLEIGPRWQPVEWHAD